MRPGQAWDVAVIAGGSIGVGLAIFRNFDLLLRVDLEYARVGPRDAFIGSASLAAEWH